MNCFFGTFPARPMKMRRENFLRLLDNLHIFPEHTFFGIPQFNFNPRLKNSPKWAYFERLYPWLFHIFTIKDFDLLRNR